MTINDGTVGPMTINIEALRKARDIIKAHPHLHDQSYFLSDPAGIEDRDTVAAVDGLDVATMEHCGTTACLAGWIVIGADTAERGQPGEHIGVAAQRIAGLSDTQAERLFYRCSDADVVATLDYIVDGDESVYPYLLRRWDEASQ